MEAKGDAVVIMAADLQDPPELLPQFIARWRDGFRIVLGVKITSEESRVMFALRRSYYRILASLSEVPVVKNFHGYGLLDRDVVDHLRRFKSPMPYLRGLISEIGFSAATVEYRQPIRRKGKSKNNLVSLFDAALLGLVTHSRVPLRLAIVLGSLMGLLSGIVGVGYFAYKLMFWDEFSVGVAPLVIGFFIFSSIQLLFLGLLGEYLVAVLTQVKDHPLVIEQERINC
jgi:glycosyltransferase involved in cell wall biosynthesis